jgi:Na+/melibiose symporter-like transporter
LRREGLFASVLAWVNKAAMSLGGFAGGFLLVWIGFHAEHGIQSANTLAAMKTFYAFVPLAGVLVAAAIMHRYPLSEAAARECQRRLESRRLHRTAA